MHTYLARCGDSLPQAEIADQVDGEQAEHQLPPDAAQVGDTVRLVELEHAAPANTMVLISLFVNI